MISSSVTVTTSSTSCWMMGKVSSPGLFSAIPSAIVVMAGSVHISPASSETRQLAAPSLNADNDDVRPERACCDGNA